jgi:hypothetical protein
MNGKLVDHNFAEPLKKAAKYSFVTSCDKVLVAVPRKLKKVVPYRPFKDRRLGFINEYYGHGRKLRDSDSEIILNEKYYGLPADYCGQIIVADVEIEKKVVAEGREYLQLIIYKLPDGTPAQYRIQIAEGMANSAGNTAGLHIPDSNLFLAFIAI